MKALLLTLGLSVVFMAIGAGVAYGVPGVTPGLLNSNDAAAADSLGTEAEAPPTQSIEPLTDEMALLNARLSAAEARADSLAELLGEQRSTYEESKTEAADLAKTLASLEPADLQGVVQRLDGRSFVQLYEASTNRNQGRLLNALTPDQAASFVRHQLPGGAARSPSRTAPPPQATTPRRAAPPRAAPRAAADSSSSTPG